MDALKAAFKTFDKELYMATNNSCLRYNHKRGTEGNFLINNAAQKRTTDRGAVLILKNKQVSGMNDFELTTWLVIK